MSDISIDITSPELVFSLSQQAVQIDFPVSLPGAGVPVGGDVGDVLTKTGAGDYATGWEPPGAAANLETYPAGENLSAGRVVIIEGGEAFYFQPADATHAGRAFGVTKTSASTGNTVTIQVQGTIQDAAFVFTADTPLWVWADGEVKNTQPATPTVLQRAGVAVEDKKLMIDFSVCILEN